MIYMVEMALLDTARRAEWEASQRFEALHAAASPFVALHEVDSADVFTGPTYRARPCIRVLRPLGPRLRRAG
jgi:hypothetical protein